MTRLFKKISKKLRGRPYYEDSKTFNYADTLKRLHQAGALERGICQIGANDGVSNDPIHPFLSEYNSVNAVLLEPQQDAYEQLCENYPKDTFPNFALLNVAFGTEAGELVFYKIDANLTEYLRQHYRPTANPSGVTSFSRDHVRAFLLNSLTSYFADKDPDDYIVTFSSRVITPKELFSHSPSGNGFDVYQVDVERHDYVVVNAILDSQYEKLPALINFEYKYLTDSEKLSISLRLQTNYRLYRHGRDLCAIRLDCASMREKPR